jgi:hypothetical protein
MPAALALCILVGSDARQMPRAIYDYGKNGDSINASSHSGYTYKTTNHRHNKYIIIKKNVDAEGGSSKRWGDSTRCNIPKTLQQISKEMAITFAPSTKTRRYT